MVATETLKQADAELKVSRLYHGAAINKVGIVDVRRRRLRKTATGKGVDTTQGVDRLGRLL